MLPKHSPSSPKPRHQWSTSKTTSQFPQKLWQPLANSVSYPSPPDLCAQLLKDMNLPAESNSSTLPKDWQELHKRMQKSPGATTNSWKYSSSKQKIWQSMRQMWLAWKKPMNIGRQTMTKDLLTGTKRSKDQRGTRKMKDMSVISSSQSLMAITPYMSLPPISNMTDCTALALLGSVSQSTDLSYSPPNTSPLMRRGSFPTVSSSHSAVTLPTQPWPTTCKPQRTGELQLSSNGTMTCIIALPPWSQSTGA